MTTTEHTATQTATDEYLDAMNEIQVKSGRRVDVADFVIGYTSGWLTPEQRSEVLDQARKIYLPGC